MLHTDSYAVLKSVANVDTLQFDFISMTPNGLLFYANISSVSTVTLFNQLYMVLSIHSCNIFIMF